MGWRPKHRNRHSSVSSHVGGWYGVSMVGVVELGIREYVWRKEPEEKKHEQLELNLPQAPSRGLHQTAP